jgi:cytochrome c-type biogenesis protein CcmH/NrfG
MDRYVRAMRAVLVGTTTALCLVSTLLFGACAMKLQPDDFPVMRLTNPPVADAQPSQ